MSRARVWFIGGGPGAPDLLTLRGAEAIAEADVVIWGRNLLMEETVTRHAREDAELLPWPPATMEELLGAYDRAKEGDLVVARLVGGDPAVYVKLGDELDRVRELGLPHEIVPGVGSLGAAAAALGGELVTAGTEQALILVPRGGSVEELARHGATMTVYMAGDRPRELQAELLAGGYPPETSCAVVHRVSWPDEEVFRCRLEELGERVEGGGLERHTLIILGPGVPGSAG